MNDRMQALEREKLELIERNAKAEEDLRDGHQSEKNKMNEKVDRLKRQIGEKDVLIESSNKKITDLEKELVLAKKDNDSLYAKIAELSREASEKQDQVKSIETKHRTTEKETTSKIKDLKQKQREKIAELQKRYDETLQEKL
jgi:hypothetical protein